MSGRADDNRRYHDDPPVLDRFLVCGLGSFGQQCAAAFKDFGVRVVAIDRAAPGSWEVPGLAEAFEALVVGDCLQPTVLEKAGIYRCRSVLLVTGDEKVNIEAAFAARRLNPRVRLVLRSGKQNLNALLAERLGNFVAFEANQLPAPAFALAAMDDGTAGLFSLDGRLLRVVRRPYRPAEPYWAGYRYVHQLNSRLRRVLDYGSTPNFYDWDPQAMLEAEKMVTCVEVAEAEGPDFRSMAAARRLTVTFGMVIRKLKTAAEKLWRSERQQAARVALVSVLTVLVLLTLGSGLFWLADPAIGPENSFYTTAILLLGGYGDLFGEIQPKEVLPWWLRLFSLLLTLAGAAFVGVLYALITQSLLVSRFQFASRRPAAPRRDHIVVIGLGAIGRRIARYLLELGQPVVGVDGDGLDAADLPQLPVVVGEPMAVLAELGLESARSVVVATEDELVNLEVGLMAQEHNPGARLVLGTSDPRFSANLTELLPGAKILNAYNLAAEAFVGAAFGEKVLDLFRLGEQTVLVTEYRIETGDTLAGQVLSRIAFGYDVVALLHQKPAQPAELMPPFDARLDPGDRLVVLASLAALRRIEQGDPHPAGWRVSAIAPRADDIRREATYMLVRICGCSIPEATHWLEALPGTLPCPLYRHQAHRLVGELERVGMNARVLSDPGVSNTGIFPE
ncbi:potassium channel protein [Gloeobacter violaceus]|uniref:Gll4410 protein n=1 Tax=Gloeobacter violaceus (strain ATCC 29082 / PCC 7421) TaxID=251221 RepID=Q7ND26_GLOVI|nr:potassium channel protein [Gloeobacter violaceus]BAC92351.1 gll4410 [Gloeobacter violaceus PCC 7421]